MIYLACAEKSNAATVAIGQARDDVQNGRTIPVPKHLRDAHYAGAKRLGHGEGYQYPHAYDGAQVDQDYLGVDKTYYQPTGRGREAKMAEYLARFNRLRGGEQPTDAGTPS